MGGDRSGRDPGETGEMPSFRGQSRNLALPGPRSFARAAFDVMMDDAAAVDRPVDFAIWLSASALKGAETEEIEQELFHQLLHIGRDDKQPWELRQHEVEAFYGEMETYGLPERLQQAVGTQIPLPNGAARS